jgi:hypothetical protein
VAGELIVIDAPDGTEREVEIPEGCTPGEEFEVEF